MSTTPKNAWVIILVDEKCHANNVEEIELYNSDVQEPDPFEFPDVKDVEVLYKNANDYKESGTYKKALLWNVEPQWSVIQGIFEVSEASISLSCKTKNDEGKTREYVLIVGVTEQELRDAGVIK